MTPLGIRIILHYHYNISGDWPEDSPAASTELTDLVNYKMLKRTKKGEPVFQITQKGTFYVEVLKNIPIPATSVHHTIELGHQCVKIFIEKEDQ